MPAPASAAATAAPATPSQRLRLSERRSLGDAEVLYGMAPKQILPDTPAAALPAHCGWQQRRGVPGTWRLRTAWTPPSEGSRGRYVVHDERTGFTWERRKRASAVVPEADSTSSSSASEPSSPVEAKASPVALAEPTFVFQTPGVQAGAADASSGSSSSGFATPQSFRLQALSPSTSCARTR